MSELTHFNEQGRAKMVDVTEKPSRTGWPWPPEKYIWPRTP